MTLQLYIGERLEEFHVSTVYHYYYMLLLAD
jgi:hypothetical protein